MILHTVLRRGCWFRTVAAMLVLVGVASPTRAWGPHTEITAAALDVLPDRDKLRKYLGDDWPRLAKDYCWMADWQEAVRPDHYADDYLLFPAMPGHVSHMLPQVRQTYAPYFRRALQAVRTESPQNAARWVGSLLHFVQDSGSPPHTTGIGGPLHAKMEQWVDATQISLKDYQPRLLGKTDKEALRGFQERMEALVEYSKVRALKLKPILEKLDKRADQPLELESALETARVTADVVHTLFTLGLAEPAKAGCTLEGKLRYKAPAGYAQVPAKVMLAGTDYSTTTDSEGGYCFRNLPAGRYTVHILALGHEAESVPVELRAGETTRLAAPELKADSIPGNLVRNPRFQVRWIKTDQPDWWRRDTQKGGRWASALIRVPVDQKCAVRVEFVADKQMPVVVRWRANPAQASDSREAALDASRKDDAGRLVAEISPDKTLKPFEKDVLFLEVLLQTEAAPAEVCRHVAVTYVPRRDGDEK